VRVCIVGKFPPIQGGVSMRTYWTAHGLAARGHEVHVVTNAKEVRRPFRMHMRAEDWERCNGSCGTGSVTVHWTDPVDRSQSYIPMASPFVSKLAAIAGRLHSECPLDVILSHYLEPYGVAGYLAAQMTGLPHIVRMAGSDAGRLWRHPQFEALYDHVLRSAEVVIAAGAVAERAIERGVDPHRVAFGGGFAVPEDLFTPDGPMLDFAALRNEVESDPDFRNLLWGEFAVDGPYFGVCGKLGESKGSFALLAAMHRLKRTGVEVGLVALAHGQPAAERSFRARARKLGLIDRVLQIPFLPHWRVPEFLRGCTAVCCLEQDFPIGFHTPMIPREVLLCGACLVGSTEVIRKLPAYARLPHGYGCVAIKDVNDVEALSDRLAAIVQDPKPAASLGARGRAFAREIQRDVPFLQILERILEGAAARRKAPVTRGSADEPAESAEGRFPFTRLAAAAINETGQSGGVGNAAVPPSDATDLARGREVLAAVERHIADGHTNLKPLAVAVETEITVAAAENEADAAILEDRPDPLFRLHMSRWAMEESDLAQLVPVRDPRLRVVRFDHDISEFRAARTVADLPAIPSRRPSYIVVFAQSGGLRREPLIVDGLTIRILELSDGTRTASEIVRELGRDADMSKSPNHLKWIESLFVYGLISLREQARKIDAAKSSRRRPPGSRHRFSAERARAD
jgi:glycosyltransferase involved in cell wall biosynthesis